MRADVYAASLLLWELLAQRKAIQRGALPEMEVLRAMAEPNIVSLDVLRPDLPARLRDAVARGLEPQEAKRSITAEEMVAILRIVDAARRGADRGWSRLSRAFDRARRSASRRRSPVAASLVCGRLGRSLLATACRRRSPTRAALPERSDRDDARSRALSPTKTRSENRDDGRPTSPSLPRFSDVDTIETKASPKPAPVAPSVQRVVAQPPRPSITSVVGLRRSRRARPLSTFTGSTDGHERPTAIRHRRSSAPSRSAPGRECTPRS